MDRAVDQPPSPVSKSTFAPVAEKGPLPPWVTAEFVAKAYEYGRLNLHALERLSKSTRPGPVESRVRSLLDDHEFRKSLERSGVYGSDHSKHSASFHRCLYRYLRHEHAPDVYRAVIQPAEEARGKQLFLNAGRFRQRLEAFSFSNSGADGTSPERSLALFVLAFGLLQPTEAQSFVESLVWRSDRFIEYFGGSATETSLANGPPAVQREVGHLASSRPFHASSGSLPAFEPRRVQVHPGEIASRGLTAGAANVANDVYRGQRPRQAASPPPPTGSVTRNAASDGVARAIPALPTFVELLAKAGAPSSPPRPSAPARTAAVPSAHAPSISARELPPSSGPRKVGLALSTTETAASEHLNPVRSPALDRDGAAHQEERISCIADAPGGSDETRLNLPAVDRGFRQESPSVGPSQQPDHARPLLAEAPSPCEQENLRTTAEALASLSVCADEVKRLERAAERTPAEPGLPEAALQKFISLRDAYLVARSAVRGFSQCPTECTGRDESCRHLATLSSAQEVGPDELATARANVAHLSDRISQSRSDADRLRDQISTMVHQLGETEPTPAPTETSLRAVVLAAARLKASAKVTESRYARVFEIARQAFLGTWHEAEKKAATSASDASALADLKEQFDQSQSLTEVRSAAEALFARAAQMAGSRSIESRVGLLRQTPSLDGYRQVAQELAASGRPTTGLAALTLLQATQPSEFLADGDAWQFVSTWLQVLCQAAADPSIRDLVPSLLMESWLPRLRAEDFPPDARLLPLQVLLAAASGHNPELIAACHDFRVLVGATFEGYPQLVRLAAFLKSRREWTIVASDPSGPVTQAAHRVKTVIDSALLGVVTKSKHSHRFRDALLGRVKPLLEAAWDELRAAESTEEEAVRSMWTRRTAPVAQIVDQALQGDAAEPFFRGLINSALADVQRSMVSYAEAHRNASETRNFLPLSELRADFARLVAQYPDWNGPFRVAESLLVQPSRETVLPGSAHALFLMSGELAEHLPGLCADASSLARWVPTGRSLDELLSGLEHPLEEERGINVLRDGHCLRQLRALGERRKWPAAKVEVFEREYKSLRAELDGQRAWVSRAWGAAAVLELDAAFTQGSCGFVSARIQDAAREQAEEAARSTSQVQGTLKAVRGRLTELRYKADEMPFDSAWRNEFTNLMGVLDERIRSAVAPGQTHDEKARAVTQLEPIIEVVSTIVTYGSQELEPLRQAVRALSPDPSVHPRAPSSDIDLGNVSTNLDLRRKVWSLFQHLQGRAPIAQPDIDEMFAAFAKMSKVYSSEQRRDEVMPYRVADLTFKGLESRFHKPGSSHFARAVRMVALPSGERFEAESEALERDMESRLDERAHYIVFLGGNLERGKRKLKRSLADGRSTLLDESRLRKLLESKQVGPGLRQAMRRTISVEAASPFRTEGHVSGDDSLYVGRKDVLAQIVSGERGAVWGARRSGKTSLLHAAREAIQKDRPAAHVVYESLQGIGVSLDSIELNAADRLARGLGWASRPDSLETFREALEKHCLERETVLLIDEVDVYVQPLLMAKNYSFNLVRQLRGVAEKHRGRISFVFAGFKYLHRAVETIRPHNDSSYPWGNFVKAAKPLSRLTIDETTELVDEGFSGILGFEYEATVPQQIFKKTGGHPALVQHFCGRLLARIKDAARLDEGRRITVADVEDTFAESEARPGEERPFIDFVEKTLDLNLGELERILIYIMAADIIGPGGDAERAFGSQEIADAVNGWFDRAERRRVSPAAIEVAVRDLCMTGMLEPFEGRYKIAFPSYVQVLIRLEETRKDRIAELISGLEDSE